MTNAECRQVLTLVEEARERREFGFPDQKFGLTEEFFQGMLERALNQLANPAGVCAGDDVAVACGLCIVGPTDWGIPPEHHRSALLAAIRGTDDGTPPIRQDERLNSQWRTGAAGNVESSQWMTPGRRRGGMRSRP